MFDKVLNPNGNFNKLLGSIENNEKVTVFGFTENEKIGVFNDTENFLLYVVESADKAASVSENFELLGKRVAIIDEVLVPHFNMFSTQKTKTFIESVQKMVLGECDVLVVVAPALLVKLPNIKTLFENNLKLEVGKNFVISNISKQLVSMGYKRVGFTEKQGDFTVRGDMIDIFSFSHDLPVKLSFFGDELEFIKEYNFETQNLTSTSFDEIEIGCNLLNLINDTVVQKAKDKTYKAIKEHDFKEQEHKENLMWIYAQIFENNYFTTPWLNVFDEDINFGIVDFLPKHSNIVFEDQKLTYDSLNVFSHEYSGSFKQDLQEGKLIDLHKDFYFEMQNVLQKLTAYGLVAFGTITTDNKLFKTQKVYNIRCLNIPYYFTNKNLLVYDILQFYKQGYTVVLFAGSVEYANAMSKLLTGSDVPNLVVNSRSLVNKQSVNIVSRQSNETVAIMEEKTVVIGTAKLLKRNTIKKQKTNVPIESFGEMLPAVGDFVVHEVHGIGVCLGFEKIKVSDMEKDYVVVQYKNNDKLFLPVENLDSLARYIGGNDHPTINKLGGVEFYKTKQKVKTQLYQTARELVELYSERINKKGVVFPKDDELQEEFEKEFPYTETPDQLKVVQEIKDDMTSEKVMDRLLCGDVGFGKTEVAMRAIFKAVSAGYQVALLCPTTILSQQHYNTILSRMGDFGITVEVLNRFKTTVQQKDIVNRVKDGKVNVIIGTHRLLSKDVTYKKLGLLVLDEEQKFGVADKEKIKQLKNNIDVLALSATPIPRSMHMSLVGIRDISVIETPPSTKLTVNTSVVEYSDEIVKNAILKELDRSGQVLIVYNNVFNIYNFYSKIKNLIGDDISIGVAHGQMTETELETAITNLYDQNTQVLIATTLIENGIDLPLANTIIVVESDKLGLSQLYQLKGRVGRSTLQSYAYFLYDGGKTLNENAVKRLQAIAEYSSLGDGYKIAMKDLEIRGAGNVLGVKQHGHMERVGYNLYVKLLKDAIGEVKGEKIKIAYDVKIDIDASASLPNYFVENSSVRMKIYSDISKLQSHDEVNKFIMSLQENFGSVPEEVVNLCFVAVVKNLAKYLPIKNIKIKNREVNIVFLQIDEPLREKLIKFWLENKNNMVLNSDNLSIITIKNFISVKEGFDFTIKLLNFVALD